MLRLDYSRVMGDWEVIQRDVDRAVASGWPTHPELMLASQNPDCETLGVADKLMKI
jgi:hypothetical protein